MSEPFVEVWQFEGVIPCETCGTEIVGKAITVDAINGWACWHEWTDAHVITEWWCPAHADDARPGATRYPETGWPKDEIMFRERPVRLIDVSVPAVP